MSATTTPPLATDAPPVPAGKQPGRKQTAASVKLTLSGEPSVQLLPPSIRDRALVRSRIRTGVLLIVLGAIIAGGLVAVGTLRTAQAQLALQAANDRTTELLGQQAQYAEAVRIDALVKQIEELQLGATATEIDWAPLVRQLLAKLPAGGALIAVDGVSVAPWATTPSVGDTDAPQLATLSIDLSTLTIQDATAYSRSLSTLDGFAGSTISKVAVGVDGRVTSKLTLTLTTGAESGRFVEGGKADATDAPSDDASEAPADAATDAPSDEASETPGTGTEEG